MHGYNIVISILNDVILVFQGDYGESFRFCASDGHPLDFYSNSRTILVHFKSDTFMTGNGLSFTYQIASRYL